MSFVDGKLAAIGHLSDPVELAGLTAWTPVANVPVDGSYRVDGTATVEFYSRTDIAQATIVEFSEGEVVNVDHATEYGHRSARQMFDVNGDGVFDPESGDMEVQPTFANFTINGIEWQDLKDPRDLLTRSQIDEIYETKANVMTYLAEYLAKSKPLISSAMPIVYPNGVDQAPVQLLESPYENMFCVAGFYGSRIKFWTEFGGTNTAWERVG